MSERSEPESIGFLLVQICRLDHARAHEFLEEIGLYRGQYHMLHALWDQDGLTHSELAGRLRVRPATVTKATQRMENAGFVMCKPDADDQREDDDRLPQSPSHAATLHDHHHRSATRAAAPGRAAYGQLSKYSWASLASRVPG